MRNLVLSLTLVLPLLAVLTVASADGTALAPVPVPAPAIGFDHSHAAFTAILSDHVDGDRVDYEALKENVADLEDYTASLEAVGAPEFHSWTREQRYAFWINAYNAYTLAIVVEHYPLKSIRDIKEGATEVWDIDFIDLAGLAIDLGEEELSLNDIEHRILRPVFEDARVHAAVNCASRGCPPLLASAFAADELDEQLTRQARAWMADPSRNRIVREKNCIELSKIFDWFAEDFERDAGSVIQWVTKYAPEDAAEWLEETENVKIRYLDYSWRLNDV